MNLHKIQTKYHYFFILHFVEAFWKCNKKVFGAVALVVNVIRWYRLPHKWTLEERKWNKINVWFPGRICAPLPRIKITEFCQVLHLTKLYKKNKCFSKNFFAFSRIRKNARFKKALISIIFRMSCCKFSAFIHEGKMKMLKCTSNIK